MIKIRQNELMWMDGLEGKKGMWPLDRKKKIMVENGILLYMEWSKEIWEQTNNKKKKK